MKVISVYERVRVYGGPEEGGWWYTALEHIASTEEATEDEGRLQELLEEVQEEYSDSDRYHIVEEEEESQGELEPSEPVTYS